MTNDYPKPIHECWRVVELDESVHILPVQDIFLHEKSCACLCGPRAEVRGEDFAFWQKMLVTHNSMDGRERRE